MELDWGTLTAVPDVAPDVTGRREDEKRDLGPGNNCHTPADTGGVSIQLRLVESPTRGAVRRQPDAIAPGASATRRSGTSGARTRAARDAAARGAAASRGRPVRARTAAASRGRAVHWADWHLDARTRRVGRAGIAAARAALEQAVPKAS
jgi:hypothetical protein